MWVTARWASTRCSTVAVAAAASDEVASAVTATHGRPSAAARSAIATTSRNSPDDETARTASPARQRNAPAAAIPHGTAAIGGPWPSLSSAASQSAWAT